MQRFTLYLLFGLSGFAGLIYESIWTQYLKLILGHSAYAQLLVLVIFMGGMTLGAWICGQYSHKIRNLLRTYILIEFSLGVLGVGFHFLFTHALSFTQNILLANTQSSFSTSIVLWLVGTLLILPQSILLGATFPLMTGAVLRRSPNHSGRPIALLYFINSLGGALGVLTSGFILISKIGLPGTVITAGFLNIVIAFTAWPFTRKSERTEIKEKPVSTTAIWSLTPRAILICSIITGFSSFLYEIAWIRMLSMVLGSSTHAFEIMLSGFIFGLAFGSLYIARILSSLKSPIKTLSVIQLSMGIAALLTLPLYNYTFEIMMILRPIVPKTELGYTIFNALIQGLCLLFMLPTTFFAGMTLPLITNLLLQKNYGEKSIGRVYAFNTLGAILGAVFAQQWLMPLFGLKSIIGLGGILDIGLGLAILWTIVQRRQVAFILTNVFSVAYAACMLGFVHLNPIKMASGIFRDSAQLLPNTTEILFHRDGKTATVTVAKIDGSLFLNTNGKTDASIALNGLTSVDESTQVLLGVLPWSLFPEAKKVAVIGFGSGMTTHTLLTIPTLEQIDTIEIEPAMIEGAQLFGDSVKLAFSDPRSKIILEDARAFFSKNKNQYDIIVSEPSNPWVNGIANLFTKEFYALASKSLSADGIFTQWINLYEMSPTSIASVLKAVSVHFPNYTLYLTDDSNLLIIASKRKIKEPSEKIFLNSAVQASLHRIMINTMDDLLLHKLGDRTQLEAFFETFQPEENSDYFSYLDINANKDRFLGFNTANLMDIKYKPLPLLPVMSDNTRARLHSITPSMTSTASVQATRSISVYKNFMHDPTAPAFDNESHLVISELKNQQAVCQGGIAEETWLNALKVIMEYTISYLPDDQMKQLWVKIKPSICMAKSPRVAHWLKIYENLVYKNYGELINHAEAFLDKKEYSADHPLVYGFLLIAQHKLGLPVQLHRMHQYSLKNDMLLQLRYLSTLTHKIDPQAN